MQTSLIGRRVEFNHVTFEIMGVAIVATGYYDDHQWQQQGSEWQLALIVPGGDGHIITRAMDEVVLLPEAK